MLHTFLQYLLLTWKNLFQFDLFAFKEFTLFVLLGFSMSDLQRNFDVLKYEFDQTKSPKFMAIRGSSRIT